MAKKPVLSALTGIRFFAALHVVLFHYLNLTLPMPKAVYHLVRYGYVGVSLFFVLSGFVLAYNYSDFATQADRARFWLARFARIYPLYFIALVLALPIYFARIPLTNLMESLKAAVKVALEASLLNAWTPWTSCGVNCPGWSLSVEAFFYLLFPVFIPLFTRLSSRKLLAVGLLLWGLGAVVPGVYALTGGAAAAHTRVQMLVRDVISFTPVLHLPQFLIGTVTGLLYTRRWESGASFWKPARLLAVLALGVIIWAMLSFEMEYSLVNNGLFAPLFAFILFVLARDHSWLTRFFSNRLLVSLGEASYAMYILQYPLAGWFARVRTGSWVTTKLDLTPLAVYVLLLIGLSLASFYLWETPTRRWIMRRFGQRRAAALENIAR